MSDPSQPKFNRRSFIKRAALTAGAGAAVAGGASYWLGAAGRASRSHGKKVIVIGIDGMDPELSLAMMAQGQLPQLRKLRATGGFSKLGTSTPPQSPVAWANFINGAGPGSHGIFDFMHRHPEQPTTAFYGAAETIPGEGTVLRRQGDPFWDFLDAAGVPTTFYDLPCNYPPSPSKHKHHRCLAGMGVPDMLGTYGTYQQFAEDGPDAPPGEGGVDEGAGKRAKLVFDMDTARAVLAGPQDSLVSDSKSILLEFLVHRDRAANAAVIEIQGKRILLNAGQWSHWTRLDFHVSAPWYMLSQKVTGVCRFYLQEVAPNFRLYVSPVNIDPSHPAVRISEPKAFVEEVSGKTGLFATTGFQEAYAPRKDSIFTDDEFIRQADSVFEERLKLLEVALRDYDDGLLFFYFSSSDLQSHILWWNSDADHPNRPAGVARSNFEHVRRLYQKLDTIIGDIVDRYGSQATIIVMSDHGFANFGRQFNLNTWLRDHGYLGPQDCTSIRANVAWNQTKAYGLGLNGLYLNMKGRERDGIVEPGAEREALLRELITGLEGAEDAGEKVIRGVYRADKIYAGNATALAPDLIIGYARGYRASWATIEGDITDEVLLANDSAWSADHCADALEVPGILFSNRPIRAASPSLVDIAPSILAEFGEDTPATMVGRCVF